MGKSTGAKKPNYENYEKWTEPTQKIVRTKSTDLDLDDEELGAFLRQQRHKNKKQYEDKKSKVHQSVVSKTKSISYDIDSEVLAKYKAELLKTTGVTNIKN